MLADTGGCRCRVKGVVVVGCDHSWALILGGSSGFGLATARTLARHGFHLAILHRDRRGAMARIEAEFDALRECEVEVRSFNADALSSEVRGRVLDELAEMLAPDGRIKVLLHSIAFGNLKPVVRPPAFDDATVAELATAVDRDQSELRSAIDRLFAAGHDALQLLATPARYSESLVLEDEDLARTVYAMGTSLVGWVQEVFSRGLFAADARVFGLTSEGNSIAWRGYAAVAAAKAALESVARAIAVELGPHGIRCNVLQAGVCDTPALRLIPDHATLIADARSRNPLGRLTRPEDVAGMVYLLSRDEAAWVNGAVIRVDGGEHVSGVRR